MFLAFALSILCALSAWFIHRLPFPPFTVNESHPVDVLALALVLGIVIGSTLKLSSEVMAWLKSIGKIMLSIGIALLGAKLDLAMIIDHSSQGLIFKLFCVVITLVLTESLGIKLGVPRGVIRLVP